MERLAMQKILQWNKSENRKPLIIWGARQVGKTYLVKELFAKNYYKDSYIYIDLKKEDEIRNFCFTTANAEKIIEFLMLLKGKIIDEKTLIIFDEAQECPNIISSLKYFCQDFKEIPVIVTGSMVRIKLQRTINKKGINETNFLFPVGKINQITIYPLSFEEFLLNSNNILYQHIKKAYINKVPLDNSLHELALEHVNRYILIGGMPEVVNTYIKTKNILKSLDILKSLYDNYLDDMELYQASRESILRSRSLFLNIFKELNKESKNFSPGLIEKNSKTRDYTSAIEWLSMTHIVNVSYQVKEYITLPLIQDSYSNFRLYLADTGMFLYQSGINAASFLLNGQENALSGIFFENLIANEIVSKDMKLFYWKGKNVAEFEFILQSSNMLFPIDVKKGKGVLNSLEKFSYHNKYTLAFKVSKNNYGFDKEKRILTIPFYYFPFLANDFANDNINSLLTNLNINNEL